MALTECMKCEMSVRKLGRGMKGSENEEKKECKKLHNDTDLVPPLVFTYVRGLGSRIKNCP